MGQAIENEDRAVDDDGLTTNAGVLADVVARHIKHDLVEVASPDGSTKAQVLVLPSGLSVSGVKEFLDEYATAPERRKGCARFVELLSFVAHVNRFKDEHTALFAQPDPKSPTLTAVLDYHEKTAKGAPRFGMHRALYTFPISDEWKAWTESNAKVMNQGQFAEFIENRIVDIADPSGAFSEKKKLAEQLGIDGFASPSALLLLSRGLSLHVGERVENRVDPATGAVTMVFAQEHADGAGNGVKVPRAFLIQIPVFREGALYQFAVRLRYRAGGGAINWFYELHRADRAFDDAFRIACDEAQKGTDLPLFYGSPEA